MIDGCVLTDGLDLAGGRVSTKLLHLLIGLPESIVTATVFLNNRVVHLHVQGMRSRVLVMTRHLIGLVVYF